MFSYLYYDIFPVIGEFFGKLSAFSSITLAELYMFFDNPVLTITYTNMFTGEILPFRMFNLNLGGKLASGLKPLLAVIWFNLPLSTPLWCAFLVSFVEFFIFASAFKFLKSVVF